MWLLRHELTEAFVQGVRLERDISSRFLSLSYTCTLFTLRADRFWEDCFVFLVFLGKVGVDHPRRKDSAESVFLYQVWAL